MKVLPLAAVAVIALSTSAFAESSMGRSNLVTQTTVLNGPYGGDSNATSIAIRDRDEAAWTGRMRRMDQLGYTKLLDRLDRRSLRY